MRHARDEIGQEGGLKQEGGLRRQGGLGQETKLGQETRRGQEGGPPGCDAERFALWALRRLAGAAPPGRPAAGDIEGCLRGLGFGAAEAEAAPVRLGVAGGPLPSKTERRLLKAVAAAQADDAALVDNYLYKLALDGAARARLADAITALAACLAVRGYWLARPAPIPAGALGVARAHGQEMGDMRVAWP